MAGSIELECTGDLARVTLANEPRRNAIDIAMWRRLAGIFRDLQAMPGPSAPAAIVVRGEGGQFASGGDIAEFASFRFDERALRAFHEEVVAPALHAMLDCDIPVFAQIEGACVGGGLEIAACCDIRLCGQGSRFGVPIARLGFPMAPGELEIVARIAPLPALREMLIEARLIGAADALRLGLVHAVCADEEVAVRTRERAEAACDLGRDAARINKRTLRQMAAGGPTEAQRHAHFGYAASDEHREGVTAFNEKRPPRFARARATGDKP